MGLTVYTGRIPETERRYNIVQLIMNTRKYLDPWPKMSIKSQISAD